MDAIGMPETVTAAVVDAAQAAGGSLADSFVSWIQHHEMAAGFAIGITVARIVLPHLQRLALTTENTIDDKAVGVLKWIVGAVGLRMK